MSTSLKPRVRRRTATKRAAPVPSRALLVIDDQRLRAAAWAEFHTARKRMEKASRDLHRHEEIDFPAYERWLHQTFPALVTRYRELQQTVLSTARKIQAAQSYAFYFGGSLKRVWRQQRERENRPEPTEDEPKAEDESESRRHEARPDDFEPPHGPKPSLDARAIYRRLVQRLHPDRGGDWTALRERLWHDVQQAWAAADADWLARLEVDWETANDVLGPTSSLSRLRQAIAELDAARRDTERKLREYREEPAWRFTRSEQTRPVLHRRIEHELIDGLRSLQRQLDHMNRRIGGWEDDWTRADVRVKREGRRRSPAERGGFPRRGE